MAEKKVAKFDASTFVIRKENGNKIICRGSSIEGEQATVREGQVLEFRREEGSVVGVVRDRGREVTYDDLIKALRAIDADGGGPWGEATDLLRPIAVALGLRLPE